MLTRLSSATLAGTALLLAGCGDREDRDLTASNEATTDQTERVAATSPSSSSTSDQRTASQSSSDQQRQERDSAAIALQEETLEVKTKEQPAGGVLVQTDVETEQVERPVELKREEAEVVRLSAEQARELQQGQEGAQQISEDKIYVPLTKEKAVVSKDVETTGGIQVTTNETTEEETIDATVRREVADVQRQGAAQDGQQSEGLEQRIRSDLRMAQDISLSDQQIDGIDIRVQENTVVLSGTVPNQQSAQRIEQRVSDIQGVQSVDNQLRPQDQSAVAE